MADPRVEKFAKAVKQVLRDGQPRTMQEIADLVDGGWLEPQTNPHLREAVWFLCRPDKDWRWSLEAK